MRRFTVNMKLARIFKRILESWNLAKNGKRFAQKRWAENMRTAVNHARINHGTVRGTYSAQIPVTLRYGATAGAAVSCASLGVAATPRGKANTAVPAPVASKRR